MNRPIKLWCVQFPDGTLDRDTIRTTRRGAIKAWERAVLYGSRHDVGDRWRAARRDGYSCVQVSLAAKR